MASDSPAPEEAIRPSIWQIEFIGDGNAVVRFTDDAERLLAADEVPQFLLAAWNRRAGGEREQQLEVENAELKADVIAFCGVWANQYAQMYGLPRGHLHPTHYDILQRCGARMDDFTRAALAGQTEGERNGG